MHRAMVLAVAVSLFGCGGSGGGTSGGDGPVSKQPLSGTVAGKPWTAGTAIAMPGFSSGEMSVTVYEQGTAADCNTFGPSGDRELLANVPWNANSSYSLDLQHNFTFTYPQDGGDFANLVATAGRIELDGAPQAPDGGSASTTLRIRGEFNSDNSVEGQVNVQVCPGF